MTHVTKGRAASAAYGQVFWCLACHMMEQGTRANIGQLTRTGGKAPDFIISYRG